MDTSNERWTAEELLTPRLIRLMKWYLIYRIPKGQRCRARRYRKENEDLIQDACLSIVRRPALRKWLATTVICCSINFVVQKAMQRHRNDRYEYTDDESILERESPCDADYELLYNERTQVVDDWISHRLDKRRADLIRDRFGLAEREETILELLSKQLKVTRERARQIEKASLEILVRIKARLLDRHGFPMIEMSLGQSGATVREKRKINRLKPSPTKDIRNLLATGIGMTMQELISAMSSKYKRGTVLNRIAGLRKYHKINDDEHGRMTLVKEPTKSTRVDQLRDYLKRIGPARGGFVVKNCGIPPSQARFYLSRKNFVRNEDGLWTHEKPEAKQ